ncbi:glycosyltransferase family 2 protein [Candidatus Saccharibacteria bacterium]|nr:glycosyltransferase family 2 protein [Candidatus Saccharibacteria bacterium]
MASAEKQSIKATVFIPTYNGERYLSDLLKGVFKQDLPYPFEVLIIDSGSKDKTLEIIKRFPKVKLHQIPNSEYGHGKTRNLAAQMANGEFVVYLSQDAVPLNKRWLEYMIEPFLVSDKIFCVYGRQVPRPFCDATTKREVSGAFRPLGTDHSIIIQRKRSLVTNKIAKPYLTFFSDVNSAVRRDYILNKIPYRDIRYSEDQFLGKDVLDADYFKAYAPLGAVAHSNEYRLRDYFYRKYDENLGIYETIGILPPPGKLFHIRKSITDTLRDYLFIVRDEDFTFLQKIRNFGSSTIRNPLKQLAAYLIANKKHRKKNGLDFSLEAKNKQAD